MKWILFFVSLGFQGHNSPTLLDRSIKKNNIFFAFCDFLMYFQKMSEYGLIL